MDGVSKTAKAAHGLNKAGAFVGGVGELGLPGGELAGDLLRKAGLADAERVFQVADGTLAVHQRADDHQP